MRTAFLLWLLAPVGVAGLAWAAPPPRAGVPLAVISFTGNHSFAAATLSDALPVKQGALVPIEVLRDETLLAAFVDQGVVQPLSSFYLDRGFVEHKLDLESVDLGLDAKGVSIRVRIVEGRRFTVGALRITGGGLPGDADLARGQVFNRSRLARLIERIARSLRDRGHAAAEVTALFDLDRARRVVDIRLAVAKGAVYHVERIEVHGSGRVGAAVIRRALAFKEGDRYSQQALERSHEQLMAKGLFESLDLILSPGSAGDRLVITVEAEEHGDCPHLEAT